MTRMPVSFRPSCNPNSNAAAALGISALSVITSITDFITKERNRQMVEEQVTPDPEDEESDIDGCDIEIENATSDEDLPDTEGGVA